jgi:hypothetical protein
MSDTKDREIFLGPENYPLKIEVKTFKGKKYIDFRKWFLDKKTSEILPTKKGIMLSEYQFRDVSDVLINQRKTIDGWFQEKIKDLDTIDLLSEETSKIRKKSQEAKRYKTVLKKIDNNNFFSLEYNNNEIQFVLNQDHELYKKIENLEKKTKDTVTKIIESLLISFRQTLEIFDPETKYKLEDLEDLLNYNWSKTLTNYLKKIK